ncbi:butyrophilin subfamily 3 member A2-like [Acanthochromis polyacanthus]|uniref:butyrophilin subfamily 3 member A2-like n=1 Tax=Acanthochromis polyacanthus TaxID=80966 RepID=UPI002234BAB5|nr:butyrophilin subfamily 3 member A2-like [Acanthochromis polyacanthus]
MMSHIKVLLKSELGVWIFLLLTHCSEGQHQLIGPTQPIVAMFGDDVVLPCRLEPAVDAAARTVEWSRPDLQQRLIHFRRDSVDLLTEQNPSYTRRTSLSISKLKSGDISLKLSKVKLSDTGTYKCNIPKFNTESAVELVVGSVSSPEIEVSKDSSSVELQCKSAGWYPQPEVLWLDGDGNLLSAGPTETVRGPDDLYTVSSRVTVEKKHGNKFTCRVQQNNITQTRETVIHVSADLFMVHSNLSARITTTMAACVLTIAVVIFIVWKWGQTRTKRQKEDEAELRKREMWMIGNDVELELLMEGQRDREQSMLGSEKMKYLKMKKAKFDEELQKNKEELEHVQQVIEVLKEQKDDLKNQKEKLLSLQQEEKMKVKEIETKKDPLLDKNKKKREKAKEEATQKKTVHEELLKNTEKLLETTEEMIVKMTERKGKLETNKEQILKHLKSTEQEIEELQKKVEESERKEDKDNPPVNIKTTGHQQERPQDLPEEEQNNPC